MNEKQHIEILKKVDSALDEIRPFLQKDGGDVELIKVSKEKAYVSFLGNCKSCSMNTSTFEHGVMQTILKAVPEIKKVEIMQDPVRLKS